MHTEKYIGLQRRLKKLREVYLPPHFSPTGAYKDSAYEKVRAYKVLVHAEIEYYFEETALIIASKAYKRWQTNKKASLPLLSLAVYYGGQYPQVPDTRTGNHSEEDLTFRIDKAYEEYNHLIRANNHGIRSKNIFSMFLPLGIELDDIDENMLIALDNFGRDRGSIAHSTRASTLTTPDDALNTVVNLMTYIEAFDLQLSALKNAIR